MPPGVCGSFLDPSGPIVRDPVPTVPGSAAFGVTGLAASSGCVFGGTICVCAAPWSWAFATATCASSIAAIIGSLAFMQCLRSSPLRNVADRPSVPRGALSLQRACRTDGPVRSAPGRWPPRPRRLNIETASGISSPKSLTENEIESFQWVESYAAREQPGGRAARTLGGSLALATSENHTSASAHIRTPVYGHFF